MKEETEADEFADNAITEEELLLAARRSFLFLTACVDGEIADAKVSDRIAAARGCWSTRPRYRACSTSC